MQNTLTICLSICLGYQAPGNGEHLAFVTWVEALDGRLCDTMWFSSMSFLTKRAKKKKLLGSGPLEMTSTTECLVDRYNHNSLVQLLIPVAKEKGEEIINYL